MLKKKAATNKSFINIALAVILVVSVGINGYLYVNLRQAKINRNDLDKQISKLKEQLAVATEEKSKLEEELEAYVNTPEENHGSGEIAIPDELLPPTKEDWGDWEPVMAPGTYIDENGMVRDQDGRNWGARPGFNPNAKEIPGTRGAKNVYVPAMGASGDLKPDEWLGDDGWVHRDMAPGEGVPSPAEREANARELERLAGVTG